MCPPISDLFCSGKLQWERDIPQDALDNLQNLANTDFHANLGKIIHDIYLTAHNLFMDMPQGNGYGEGPTDFKYNYIGRVL
jgi:hypothetical protein